MNVKNTSRPGAAAVQRSGNLVPVARMLTVMLVLLGAMVVLFLLTVSRQWDSLVQRQHRALARYSVRIDARIRNEGEQLARLALDIARANNLVGEDGTSEQTRAAKREKNRKKASRQFWSPGNEDVIHGWFSSSSDRPVEVKVVENAGDEDRRCEGYPIAVSIDLPNVCLNYEMRPEDGGGQVSVRLTWWSEFAPDTFLRVTRPVSFDSLFEPARTREQFDHLLVSDGTGKVVYKYGDPAAGVADLHSMLQVGRDTEEEPAPHLFSHSGHHQVDVAGRSYWLFSKPLRNFAVSGTEESTGDAGRIIVAGLSDARELRWESVRISPTRLMRIMFIGLLCFLSVPLLKLRWLGATDKVKTVEVVLVVLCTFYGVGLVAMTAVDVFYYREYRAVLDGQLRTLAKEIKSRLDSELRQCHETLRTYARATSPSPVGAERMVLQEMGRIDRQQALRLEQRVEEGPAPGDILDGVGRRYILEHYVPGHGESFYPFLTTIFRGDDSGVQHEKYSIRGKNTRWTSVRHRAYHNRLAADPYLLDLGGDEGSPPIHYRLEPIDSFTDGRREAVYATWLPDGHPPGDDGPDLPRGYMSMKLHSLYGVVLPARFGFAVVDADGEVLFHSDERNNLRENFVTECDDSNWLLASIAGRTGPTGDVRYRGENHRMHISPLEGLPWSLAVFQETYPRRLMNLEAITLAWSIYTPPYVLLFLLILATFSPYRSRWMARPFWHDWRKCRRYALLFSALTATTLFCLYLATTVAGPGPVMIGISASLSAIAAVYLLLGPSVGGGGHAGALGKGMTLAATFLLVLAVMLPLGVIVVNGRFSVWWLLIMAALPAAIGSWLYRRSVHVTAGSAASRAVYTAMAVSVVLVVSVVPTASLIEYTFEHEIDLLIRNHQRDLALDLEKRKSGVLAFYADVKHRPEFMRYRLEPGRNDIYSRFWFDSDITRAGADESVERRPASVVRTAAGRFLRAIRPYFGEYTTRSADLDVDHAPERGWGWTGSGADTVLAYVDPGAKCFDGVEESSPGGLKISTRTNYYSRMPEAVIVAGVAVLSLLCVPLVRFLADRMVFLRRRGTRMKTPGEIDLDNLGDRTLVIGAGGAAIDLLLENERIEVPDLSGGWSPAAVVEALEPEVLVVVREFEAALDQAGEHCRLLDLIDLLEERGYRSLFFGRRHPNDGFPWDIQADRYPHAPDENIAVRWGDTWNRFQVIVVADDDPQWKLEGLHPDRDLVAVLQHECRHSGELRAVAETIDRHDHDAGSGQVESLILQRAAPVYMKIWNESSRTERRVLYGIARYGIANWRNEEVLTQLEKRNLVRVNPGVELFNRTFALWVRERGAGEGLFEPSAGEMPSRWRRFRTPILAVLLAIAVVLFATQPALFNSVIASLSAIAAVIPISLHLLKALRGAPSTDKPS